ncbi:hypothetical protein J6X90_03260 [Candidatus Saccharibacteria bacterium]|nr:hypothetical protein [Candidatus Saccharibacteria bacterium]
MSIYQEPDFTHVHPPKEDETIISRVGRYLSKENGTLLVSLLHAVVQTHEDEQFAWPEVSRGRFRMRYREEDEEQKKTVISFKFAGTDPDESVLKAQKLRLCTDDCDVIYVEIYVTPPEVKESTEEGWHALCLAKDLEYELAYATLCFFEQTHPSNGNLLRIISTEKNRILHIEGHSFENAKKWQEHLYELETYVRDTIHNSGYVTGRTDEEGLGRIPQYTRNYRAWFNEQESKKVV